MKFFKGAVWTLLCLSIGIPAVRAGSEHMMAPYVGSAEFERLKKLAGVWEGKGDMHGKPEKIRVEYAVSSGGSVLIEKLGAGTPHEMVDVYQERDGKVLMTHYCLMRNQPQMALKSSDDKSVVFDFVKTPGINPKKDEHMHALTLAWEKDGKLTQTWKNWKGGKEAGSAVFTLTRKK
jgi:hypothetical protein